MANLNRVILIGRLTRDTDLTKTKTDVDCAKFGLALTNGFGDKKKVVFVEITAWGKTASFVSTNFKKGNEILIEGRLDFEQWESKEGEKKQKLYVTAESVGFVGYAEKKEKSAVE